MVAQLQYVAFALWVDILINPKAENLSLESVTDQILKASMFSMFYRGLIIPPAAKTLTFPSCAQIVVASGDSLVQVQRYCQR